MSILAFNVKTGLSVNAIVTLTPNGTTLVDSTNIGIANLQFLNVSANIANTGNLLVTQNTVTGNLTVTQNVALGNLSITQNLSAGNLSITTLAVSANIANAGNVLVTQNTKSGNVIVSQNSSTGNLSVTQNASFGNISTANITTTAAINSPYVATVNNGAVVLGTANINFNSTSTINVAIAANGTNQANISLSANLAGITANPGGGNTQVQFNNNGALGGSANVTFNLNGNTFTVGSNTVTGNLTVSQNASIGNLTVSQNTTMGNVAITGNLIVTGVTTILNTTNMDVDANAIYLNANQAGSPTLNAYVYATRGSSTNTFEIWDETHGKWGYSNDGTTIRYFSDIDAVANAANLQANLTNASVNLAYFPNSFQTTNTSQVIIDAWSANTYRSAKYLISVFANIANANVYEALEVLIIQDGTFTYSTEYADVYTGQQLGVFSSAIAANQVMFNVTPTSANTLVRTVRTLIPI